MKNGFDINTAKNLWRNEKDNYIIKAIENISEYPSEIQDIIMEEAIKRGLYSYNESINHNSKVSLHKEWIDLSSDIQMGHFCPSCKTIYLDNINTHCQCNVPLNQLGYCSKCNKFWQLIPGESCPIDGCELVNKRLTTIENSIKIGQNIFSFGIGFLIYLFFKKIFGVLMGVPFLGTIMCLLIFNKILPSSKKPLVLAISLQTGWYLPFLIIGIISKNIDMSGLAETLIVLGFILWLILKPNIYPVIILTIIHILSLLAIFLIVMSLITVENTNLTFKSLLINMIFKIPAIIFMYLGLREIKKQEHRPYFNEQITPLMVKK